MGEKENVGKYHQEREIRNDETANEVLLDVDIEGGRHSRFYQRTILEKELGDHESCFPNQFTFLKRPRRLTFKHPPKHIVNNLLFSFHVESFD